MHWLFSLFTGHKGKIKPSGGGDGDLEPEKLIKAFLGSLFGYSNYTRDTYEKKLLTGKNSFISFLDSKFIENIRHVTRKDLNEYRESVRTHVSDQTTNGYVTAVRQLYKFLTYTGYVSENIAVDLHLPQTLGNTEIDVLRPEVAELLLNTDFGKNPMTIARARLILSLMINRGLLPSEIAKIELDDIETYKDLRILTVRGKKSRRRDVMLDPFTVKVLDRYLEVRGYFLAWHKVIYNHLIVSDPRGGNYYLKTSGVSGIVTRAVLQLQKQGCPYNLKGVCPRLMRNTAKVNDWEPRYIQHDKETEYVKMKEESLRSDSRGFMNRFRVIKEA